jgi:hypothetical protein
MIGGVPAADLCSRDLSSLPQNRAVADGGLAYLENARQVPRPMPSSAAAGWGGRQSGCVMSRSS